MKPDSYSWLGDHQPRWFEDALKRSMEYFDGDTYRTYEQAPASGRMVVTNPPLQAEPKAAQGSSTTTGRITTAIQPNTLPELKALREDYILGEFKTAKRTDVLLAASIGKLDELIEELKAPSGSPVTDEYEDGFNACLALVEDFRDELRRQEGTL